MIARRRDGWTCSYCDIVLLSKDEATQHQGHTHAAEIVLTEGEKPPLGPTPYCAGCHRPLPECDRLESCVGFYTPTLLT